MRASTRIAWCGMVIQLLWLCAGCRSQSSVVYEWTGVGVAHLDNRGRAPAEVQGGSIPAEAYGIRMAPGYRGISKGPGLEPGSYESRDTLTALRIEALPPEPGSAPRDVTGEFLALDPERPAGFLTVPDLLHVLNVRPISSDDGVDLIRVGSREPADGVRFAVTLTTAAGKVLADTTEPITLY